MKRGIRRIYTSIGMSMTHEHEYDEIEIVNDIMDVVKLS